MAPKGRAVLAGLGTAATFAAPAYGASPVLPDLDQAAPANIKKGTTPTVTVLRTCPDTATCPQ